MNAINQKRGLREYLPSALNVISALIALSIGFIADIKLPISKSSAMVLGVLLILLGGFLFVWAASKIKEAILGEVEPRLSVLVKDGPYRLVRHPVYLGTTIMLAGATIALRSPLGFIAVFVLFLPTEVYRAKLEERALERKFKEEWKRYAAQTGFFIPKVG